MPGPPFRLCLPGPEVEIPRCGSSGTQLSPGALASELAPVLTGCPRPAHTCPRLSPRSRFGEAFRRDVNRFFHLGLFLCMERHVYYYLYSI